jgi:hypothetical protein
LVVVATATVAGCDACGERKLAYPIAGSPEA